MNPEAKLKIDQLEHTLGQLQKTLKDFHNMAEQSDELREWAKGEIIRYAMSISTAKLDKDELNNFFKYPYVILSAKREGEIYLAIPKFINVQIGWLEKVTPSYNIFLVNRYVDWLGGLPAFLKKELKMQDPLDIVLEGDYLVGPDSKIAQDKFRQFIKKIEPDGRLLIDKSRNFELLAALIKDGILPFTPKEIAKEDKIDRKCDFELRDYQIKIYAEFVKYSNVGVFIPPSTGKTFLGLYAMTHVAGPWIVFCPSRLLVEQWKERIELYTDLVIGVDVDVVTYQAGIKGGKKYRGKIIDETHHLPSNEFSKIASIQTDFTIGLSATPQREDQREEYIFALTGKPVGLDWETFKKLGIIQSPPLHVWIVKNETERITKVGSLLQEEQKTIIFCDSIEMGAGIAKKFDLPHIHGASKDRLMKIKDTLCSVVSRVGDEGISLPDITRIIEVSWLHGSRRQELQRFTRLLHGKNNQGEAHIIMTGQEYQSDHKRLYGIMDKGFKIIIHTGEREKSIQTNVPSLEVRVNRKIHAGELVGKKDLKKYSIVNRITNKESKVEPNDFEKHHPLLSLPGTQKKLALLTRAERLSCRVFYEKKVPMTRMEVWNFVGIGRAMDFANFTKMVELGLIKMIKTPKEPDRWQCL